MRRYRRLRNVLFDVAIVVFSGCVGRTSSYSPERDDGAMSAIARTWSAPSTDLVVSLCEDVTAPESDNTCQVEHVVRGGSSGRRHEEQHGGIGCGGCPFEAVAYVEGVASGGALVGTVAVAGEIRLSATANDDPYAFPYSVELRCVDVGMTCTLSGTLLEDGTLDIAANPSNGTPGARVVLGSTGAATCP